MNYFTPQKNKNWALRAFWEIARFICRNGRKNTFEWPKVVSEVIFPRFWGVVCIEKCFRIFVSVIGSALSEMSRFAQFYVFRPLRHKKRAISQKALSARFWFFWGWYSSLPFIKWRWKSFWRIIFCYHIMINKSPPQPSSSSLSSSSSSKGWKCGGSQWLLPVPISHH